MGPDLNDHLSAVFWAAFLLFSWTTGSIMSGALIERARLTAYLRADGHPRLRDLDPRRRLGLERRRLAGHRIRLPRRIASSVVHGVAGAFTLGVLFQLGPSIGKYDVMGRARTFRPHNLHLTLLG